MYAELTADYIGRGEADNAGIMGARAAHYASVYLASDDFLSGADGCLVDLVMDVHGRGTFERARLDAVHACPGCEFIGRRAAANERMRRAAETEYRSASNTPIGIYARIQRRRT